MTERRPAVDASPLIFLAHADLLDLLQLLGDEVVVPSPVAREILARGPKDPTAKAIESAAWLEIIDPPPVPDRILNWDLGPGESSVLAWCGSYSVEAVIDDLSARRCAQTFGIPVRGTLGLVLLAKRRQRLSLARPVLESLRDSGMYLSTRVLNRALETVGE